MKTHLIYKSALVILILTIWSLTIVNVQTKPWKVPVKYIKMLNPTTKNKENLKIGRILYSKHCKSCHGTKGKGDGVKAKKIDTPMEDLSTAEIQSQKDGAFFYKISTGRNDMPKFSKKIPDDEDRWLIVNYMRTLKE